MLISISITVLINFLSREANKNSFLGAIFHHVIVKKLVSPSVLLTVIIKIMKCFQMKRKKAISKDFLKASQDLKVRLTKLIQSSTLLLLAKTIHKYHQMLPSLILYNSLNLSRLQCLRVLSILIMMAKSCYFLSHLTPTQDATQLSEHSCIYLLERVLLVVKAGNLHTLAFSILSGLDRSFNVKRLADT
jgi:hypothetical protein